MAPEETREPGVESELAGKIFLAPSQRFDTFSESAGAYSASRACVLVGQPTEMRGIADGSAADVERDQPRRRQDRPRVCRRTLWRTGGDPHRRLKAALREAPAYVMPFVNYQVQPQQEFILAIFEGLIMARREQCRLRKPNIHSRFEFPFYTFLRVLGAKKETFPA